MNQEAREESPGAAHQPYVPDQTTLPEFTWPAVLVGAVLGIVFGASSLYLVMKVGMTVSASIPVAVLAITLFRAFSHSFGFRRASILENNIVQTTGSAGESIAFGVGITMPAVMILGFEMEWLRVMVVSVLGGVLGILMMVPLRRAFCVKQHGTLKFPEGTACADVLVIGETGGATAKTVFVGFSIAFVYQFLNLGLKLWRDSVAKPLIWLKGATPAMDVSPALLGVGYIIGTRISCIMVAGGVLASFVFCPMIMYFGGGLSGPLAPAMPGDPVIGKMTADNLHDFYVLYIGAGAVAAGGIISMCRTLPLIISSIFAGIRDMRALAGAGGGQVLRTTHDLSMRTVFLGCLVLIAGIWAFLVFDPQGGGSLSPGSLAISLAAAVLIMLFGFLFVVVSARLTGEIGSSSNPISGMTVATLLLTCLIFLALGWTSQKDQLIALSVAAVVCIASSNGGTNAQTLKTGFLVGATPRWQQYAILIGSLTSAVVIGGTLLALNYGATVYSSQSQNLPKAVPLNLEAIEKADVREKAPDDDTLYLVWHPVVGNPEHVNPGKYLIDDRGHAHYLVDPGIGGHLTHTDDGREVKKFHPPQAELFAVITQGILNQKLPWILLGLGVLVALVMELCGVSSLAFAVGVYLPLSSTAPIFVGGLVRWVVERLSRKQGDKPASELETEMSSGSLFSTGYIAGGTIGAVLINFLVFWPAATDTMSVWQYRTSPAPVQATLDEQCRALAIEELGVTAPAKPEKESGAAAGKEKRTAVEARIDILADEVDELNRSKLHNYTRVSKGAMLKLAGKETYQAPADMTLAEVADIVKDKLKGEDKVKLLFDINADRLKEPEALPPGTPMKLPQRNSPALIAFGILALLLVLVGGGWLLNSKEDPA